MIAQTAEMNTKIKEDEWYKHGRKKPRCHALVSDFANMVKAFIGSNYLSIAYAFKQSGLVIGLAGLLIIASVTDHCCNLIVKCKYAAIQEVSDRLLPVEEDKEKAIIISKRMVRSLTYGDIGKIACGSIGIVLVNICIIFTQLGFCIGYFIFIGNTISSLFPTRNCSQSLNETSCLNLSISSEASSGIKDGHSVEHVVASLRFNYLDSLENDSVYTVINNSSPTLVTNASAQVNFVEISEAPDLRLLVISPLPVFALFVFLRNVRHLGFVSVAANVSIFLGCVIILIYMIIGFKLSSTWELFNWATFPVFFGMVTSAYEGIGTIIPIESSMEGNHHNFPRFLHGAILILSCVLTIFGVTGYLQYGHDTEQMLSKNIPTSDGFGMAINIFLCVGVLLTFPLMIFPVIELIEIYIFAQGSICGPKKTIGRNHGSSSEWQSSNDDKVALLLKESSVMPEPVVLIVSKEVPSWKRNLLRILIVLCAAGIAVLMRDMFAYVNAFIGAIGSSLLTYVLPCLFHLKLRWYELGCLMRAKDIFIIVFGIVASIVSLYVTISEVVSKFG